MSSLKNSSSMVKFLKEFNYKEFFKKNKIVLLSILAGLIIASSLIFYRISEKK